MNKLEFRAKYNKLRATLSEEQIDERSLAIANKSLELPIWDKLYYHLFLPISEKNEIDTQYLLHILQGRDKSVVISKSNFVSNIMQHILLQENTVLIKSKYGIPEPVDGIVIPVEKIDVVFVPLLVYDKKGNRIGYGKGFYDKFLSQCNSKTLFIGLSFFEPEDKIPNEIIDVPLHYCITPINIHAF